MALNYHDDNYLERKPHQSWLVFIQVLWLNWNLEMLGFFVERGKLKKKTFGSG